MKILGVDNNYDFKFADGDLVFEYNNDAILSLSKQIGETIYGELTDLPKYGVLDLGGRIDTSRLLSTLARLEYAISSLEGVTNVNIVSLNQNVHGNYYYDLEISTIYQGDALKFSLMELIHE